MPQSQTEKAACTRAWRERIRGLEPPVHGTPGAYFNYACRCAVCKAAKKVRDDRYRQQRHEMRAQLAQLLQLIRERDFKALVKLEREMRSGSDAAA